MNILYITNKDPRLQSGGNEQRTNLLWECLKRNGNVYTIVINGGGNKTHEYVGGSNPIVIMKQNTRKIFSIWFVLHQILSRFTGINIYSYKLQKEKIPIDYFGEVKFDRIVTRYLFPLCDCNLWKIAPVYVDIDDHPSQVFETTIKPKIFPLLRPFAKKILDKQLNYLISKVSGGWLSNREQVALCGNSFAYLPNIPNSPAVDYNAEEKQRKYLFTVGNMAYQPNYAGVNKFLLEIWVNFVEKHPESQYIIVGKGAPQKLINKWSKIEGVKYLGFVDNINDIYQYAIASVVPVYSGGGTCIKTLEALSFSRLCISTEFGARGLDKGKINGFISLFNSLDDFEACYKLCMDNNYRKLGEKQGKEFLMKENSKQYFYDSVTKMLNF